MKCELFISRNIYIGTAMRDRIFFSLLTEEKFQVEE
mgnify:CR=1 FL=1